MTEAFDVKEINGFLDDKLEKGEEIYGQHLLLLNTTCVSW